MVFESTSMRYETLVARFWLRVRGYACVEFPRVHVAVSHVIKDKSSGVENGIASFDSKNPACGCDDGYVFL